MERGDARERDETSLQVLEEVHVGYARTDGSTTGKQNVTITIYVGSVARQD